MQALGCRRNYSPAEGPRADVMWGTARLSVLHISPECISPSDDYLPFLESRRSCSGLTGWKSKWCQGHGGLLPGDESFIHRSNK